jgi:hypothetical protein
MSPVSARSRGDARRRKIPQPEQRREFFPCSGVSSAGGAARAKATVQRSSSWAVDRPNERPLPFPVRGSQLGGDVRVLMEEVGLLAGVGLVHRSMQPSG